MVESQLLGVWVLRACVYTFENGERVYPYGPDASGVIWYAPDGRMAVQISAADRASFASPNPQAGAEAEYASAGRSYFAYFGTFVLDADRARVTHTVEGSLFPNLTGQRLERTCALADGVLTLTADPMPTPRGAMTAVMTWARPPEDRS